jgi:DNA gyrase subunit B
MDFNPSEKRFNWELVYCTLYASGKYDSDNYKTSLGLNGLGCTATQYASEYMTVTSVRDGFKYTMKFEKGIPVGELSKEPSNDVTGTTVEFRPDEEVFSSIEVEKDFYALQLLRQAMLHGGLKFNLDFKGDKQEFVFESGAVGYLKSCCKHNSITKEPLQFTSKTTCTGHKGEYNLDMRFVVTFSREENSQCEVYHNGGYLSDGGVTDDAINNEICRALEDCVKSENILGKNDKILPKYLDGVVHYIGETGCPGSMTEFKNQTKTAITNKEIKKAYSAFVYQNIYRWLTYNMEDAKKIVNEVLINKKALDSADAIRKNVLKKLTQNIDNVRNQPEKFVDCASHKNGNEEIWIVEGDSAAGACVQARDSQFQAIIPVRGKIINCLKNSLADILKSDIIIDLIRVLGCGIEARTKQVKDLPDFDITKLRWDKIVICTDADIDGMQIRCLILAMIYKLMPSLLGADKVFIAETPLFEINTKEHTYFAYSDEERDKTIGELEKANTKYKIQRSKGLGENEPDMMWQSTMCPETRKLVPIEIKENDKELIEVFDALLGDNIMGRKAMISEHFDMEFDAE